MDTENKPPKPEPSSPLPDPAHPATWQAGFAFGRKLAAWCTVFGVDRLVVILALAGGLAVLFSVNQTVSEWLFVGLWTCFCVMLGQYLAYKRHVEASPFPPGIPPVDSGRATELLVQHLLAQRKKSAEAAPEVPPRQFKL